VDTSVAEQLEGSCSFSDSSKCCLAEIHAVPRGHTWREATVAQVPWLYVRRFASPLEPYRELS
jgi:hypothetical protein